MRLSLTFACAALLWLATTAFQCAPPELTSGKLYLKQQQYDRAAEALESAVRKLPKSEEAWYLLAYCAHERGDFERMAEALDTAAECGKQFLKDEQQLRRGTWIQMWNDAVGLRNSGAGKPDSLRKAMRYLQIAYRLDPSKADPLGVVGSTEMMLGDTASALAWYQKEIEAGAAALGAGLDAGLFLGMSQDQADALLGKASDVRTTPSGESHQQRTYAPRNAKLYFKPDSASAPAKLVGWTFSASSQPADQRDALIRFSLDAYWQLASVHYSRGSTMLAQFAEHPGADSAAWRAGCAEMLLAAPYLSIIQRADPSDENAFSYLSQIYQRTGRWGEAMKSAEDLVRRFPAAERFRIQRAALLLRANRYSDAVAGLEEVTARNDTSSAALYYLAVAYKNWSAEMQQAAREKHGENVPPEVAAPFVEKLGLAQKNFEKLHKMKPQEFQPLGQLAEIYSFLNDNSKLKDVAAALESIQPAQESNPEYWNALGTIYTRLNNKKKAEEAFQKVEALGRK
jgi:tetratricopeptide (TPR) repeat protein